MYMKEWKEKKENDECDDNTFMLNCDYVTPCEEVSLMHLTLTSFGFTDKGASILNYALTCAH